MDLPALKKNRGVQKSFLTKSMTALQALDVENIPINNLKNRRTLVEAHFNKFEQFQDLIEEKVIDDDAELGVQMVEREEAEAKFIEIVSLIDNMIDEKTPQPASNSTSSCSHRSAPSIKLPTIHLPTFSGKYADWPSFSDLFEATIHRNMSLDDVQKLQYLKSSVTDEASTMIKNLPTISTNYQEAWNMLKDRYENNREIVYALLKRLFTQSSVKLESASCIQKLLDTTNECISSLKNMKQPIEHWDSILIYITTDKLDAETKKHWAMKLTGTDIPTFKDLNEFLEQHIRGLLASGQLSKSTKFISQGKTATSSHHISSNSKCVICSSEHPIFHCKSFMSASIAERNNLVKKHRLCFNCLRSDHRSSSCRSTSTCKKCQRKHHTLLHLDNYTRVNGNTDHGNNAQNPAASNSSEAGVASHFASEEDENEDTHVLLATAIVKVTDRSGGQQLCRVLLDQGSQASFISESCARNLGLQRHHSNISITGISGGVSASTRGKVYLTLHSAISEHSIDIHALILKKVTGFLPKFVCENNDWNHLTGLQLADPHYFQPGHIDILLGADYTGSVMLDGISKGKKNTPIGQNTMFGWVLSGTVPLEQQQSIHAHHVAVQAEDILQKFWELEELPTIKHLSPVEQQCEDHFTATHRRREDGKFEVELPFNSKLEQLGYSKGIAINRLKQVERRLARQPEQRQQYNKFMSDYIALGHMELIPEEEKGEIVGKTNYLPYHYVMKTSHSSTKFRVVFDGSAKSSSGISFNDCLQVGPTVQDDLYTLLLRFRTHAIALKGDVGKMYRQFLIKKEHCNFQRIVWREAPDLPIQEFKLLTVTYGTSPAPFLATRCLNELSTITKDSHPTASQALGNDMYVDDLMSGEKDSKSAIHLQQELTTVVKSAGLELLKWSSNSKEVIESIPPEFREVKAEHSFEEDNIIRALGVKWNPETDNFSFSVNSIRHEGKVTKRIILSELAKVYDPIGFLAPLLITIKILFQQLWKLKLEWDEEVPYDILCKWNGHIDQLKLIAHFTIPRHIYCPDPAHIELHGFADASIIAYGAAIYMRSITSSGEVKTSLITAKTKVAPVKQTTLPRLELCAALMCSQLLTAVIKALKVNCNATAWTDSSIVLTWLSSYPSRWQTFVGNRVAKIQENIPCENWNYVHTEYNPADCASRGLSPAELINFKLWWDGPTWLSSKNVPTFTYNISTPKDELEIRKKELVAHVVERICNTEMFSNCKTLTKLKRVTAYVFRFLSHISKGRQFGEARSGPLSVEELQKSADFWIRQAQATTFKKEINDIQKSGSVSRSSKLHKLVPYLDGSNIIRATGRLERADIPEHRKHPIILPHDHAITRMLISHHHQILHHAGFQLLMSTLQRDFCILRARDTIRHMIQRCVVCRSKKAETAKQLMGQLPTQRVNTSRPFESSGVDFAGPFSIRLMKGRCNKTFKAYMCIFVCMSTRAVHLEPVSELSTEAFISTLKRFIGRRGMCLNLFSDCGTNFVGADKELKKMLVSYTHQHAVADHLACRGINWTFNPPSAPHHGGLWEAGVKSAKFHLRRIMGNARVTYEEFHTILCQVEACMNSRPICPSSSDIADLTPLTPGHFLIGDALTAIPEADLTHLKENRLSRWQRTQQMIQHFWTRWSSEYLTTLLQRNKWTKKYENITVGELVLIRDEVLPPSKWRVGRVIEVHNSIDGHVRSVKINTVSGILTRPIVKIVPLLKY